MYVFYVTDKFRVSHQAILYKIRHQPLRPTTVVFLLSLESTVYQSRPNLFLLIEPEPLFQDFLLELDDSLYCYVCLMYLIKSLSTAALQMILTFALNLIDSLGDSRHSIFDAQNHI